MDVSFFRATVGVALGLSLTSVSSAWASTPATLTAAPTASRPKLSQVLSKNLVGLELEESSQGTWERWRKQARDFLAFRSGKMRLVDKLAWLRSCVTHPLENTYCEFASPRGLRGWESFASGARLETASAAIRPEAVQRWLRAGDVEHLEAVPEGRLIRALKGIPSWSQLEAIAQKELENKSCVTPALSTALGLKAEEFFPDFKMREWAEKLYTRAAQCGQASEEPEKARFRLSLILIWDGKLEQALPHLKTLSDVVDGDYVARSLFWIAHIAEKLGKKGLRAEAIAKLSREFPLGYHTLFLNPAADLWIREVLGQGEPLVMYRSLKRPDLNGPVRAVEVLQSLEVSKNARGAISDASRHILNAILSKTSGAEPEFRLYLASLMSRISDDIAVFKILTGIFRDDHRAISRATLELFYPLKRFEILKHHASSLDPFLVAALIRQESGFNERAKSPVGAMGLMQLLPSTARRFERVSHRELFDAQTNIRLGSKFFKQLLNRYNGDGDLALAAYNAGPEKVDAWVKRYPLDNRILFFDLIPFRETRDYVSLISRNYYWYRSLYSEPTRGLASAETPQRMEVRGLKFTLFQGMEQAMSRTPAAVSEAAAAAAASKEL